jgi:hypothetical protein
MPNTIRHVDIDRAQRLFNEMMEMSADGTPAATDIMSLLSALYCNGLMEDAFSYEATDNEIGVSKLLFATLGEVLHHPEDDNDVEIALLIESLIAHGRWRFASMEDYFNLACALVLLAEDVVPDQVNFTNVFRDTSIAMSSPDWPFPGHAGLGEDFLKYGGEDSVRSICAGAFGTIWWDVMDPKLNSCSVVDMLLTTTPPLLAGRFTTTSVTHTLALPSID